MPHGTRMEKTMRAEIITIGDELLIGQVVDTNSAWMAEKLNELYGKYLIENCVFNPGRSKHKR